MPAWRWAIEQLALREAGNQLTLARAEMHMFDPKPVTDVLQAGLAITAKVDADGEAALDEVSYRRTGLAVSLGAIHPGGGRATLEDPQPQVVSLDPPDALPSHTG